MTCMNNLCHVLEHIVNGFDNVWRGIRTFESESAFLFNSNSYSLQKSSAIQ